jgi:5-methylcytosine-specific restriction enzyme subunit McrC
MTAATREALEPLYEYRPYLIPRHALTEATGEYLYREFKKQLAVEFPSPATENQWRLTPQGYVGFIPLPDGRTLELKSKTPLGNLFHMLEYTFDIEPLAGLVEVATLDDFYERLAALLSTMVLERTRRGIYREYVRHEERLPFIRGSIDLRRAATRPWDPFLRCRYQQHTPDIDENRILTWTLHTIVRSGRAGHRSLPLVRRAYHAMESFALAQPYAGTDCADRRYNRLNDDYERLHALCRFFLDSAGPQLESGGRSMVPFLIDAAKLYEEFVAAWLHRNTGDLYNVASQVPVDYDGTPDMRSRIDLTLKRRGSDEVICVLDTKYKVSDEPSYSDMYQVTSYALTQGCHHAFLVYPEALRPPMDIRARPENDPFSDRAVRIRSLTFPVRDESCAADAELNACGERFLLDLGAALADTLRPDVVALTPTG